jgi:hypothetical protein
MPATSPPPKGAPHTGAYLAFEQNLDFIAVLLVLRHREVAAAKAAARRYLAKAKKLTKQNLTDKKKALKKVTNAISWSQKAHETMMGRIEMVTLWQVVMLVTCVEAYLQDVLSAAASVDPDLMSKSEHVARYPDVIAASSLEALADGLRGQWARGWLSNGGPTRWIVRLEQLGARGYSKDLAARLERIWGIRHVVVHSAGIATAEFVKLHPGVVTKTGERVHVHYNAFGPFLNAVKEFLETTEQFFLARYPSLVTTTQPPGAAKVALGLRRRRALPKALH